MSFPRRPTISATLRAALLAMLSTAAIPTVAAGQGVPRDSLLRRIDLVERRSADLERRVRELEAMIKAEPSQERRPAASGNWRDVQNWRQLRMGMSYAEVRALLGEPKRVDAGLVTYWHWDNADVQFREDRLIGWSEPRR